MMTPQEKAKELVDKIYYCQRYEDGENYIPLEAYKRAKQCALIACNEVLGYMGADRGYEFWMTVKLEIEKL